MDVFIQHFQKDWRTNIDTLNSKLVDFNTICRICFNTENISPIHEMVHEEQDITMVNIIESCLPLQLDSMDMLPNQLCPSCTNMLVNFYSFRENFKLSEQVLLVAREKIIEFIDDQLTEITILVDDSSDNEVSISDEKSNNKKEKSNGNNENSSENSNYGNDSDEKSDNNNKIDSKISDDNNKEKQVIHKRRVKKKFFKEIVNTKIKCVDCKAEFDVLSQLRAHCNENDHNFDNCNCICGICNKVVRGLAIAAHMRVHTDEKEHKCDKCPMSFKQRSNLIRHGIVHTEDKPFGCKLCSYACRQKGSLDYHMQSIHENGTRKIGRNRIKGEKREYTCTECDRTFERINFYNDHMERHKKLKLELAVINRESSTTDENGCNNSDKHENEFLKTNDNVSIKTNDNVSIKTNDNVSLKTNNNIVETALVTSNLIKLEISCEICEKSFKSNIQLYHHKRNHHSEKAFLCTDCGRTYTNNAQLKSHTKVHTREKPFCCTICGKQFAYVNSLNLHMNTHTGFRPHRCDVCGKRFTQYAHLQYHLFLHKGVKPFVCSYCNRAFAQKGNLTVHMRTHTGETPYLCDVCERGFYDSSSRKRHRSGHSEEEVIEAKEKKAQAKKVEQESEKGEENIGAKVDNIKFCNIDFVE